MFSTRAGVECVLRYQISMMHGTGRNNIPTQACAIAFQGVFRPSQMIRMDSFTALSVLVILTRKRLASCSRFISTQPEVTSRNICLSLGNGKVRLSHLGNRGGDAGGATQG